MVNIEKVAEEADMIFCGYAYTKDKETGWIRVLNLHCPTKAAVITTEGEVIETTMDDIEMVIAVEYYMKNKEYMGEDEHAQVL